ncbi:hypothetical protein ACN28S_03615 [Cystobacter fuscus]
MSTENEAVNRPHASSAGRRGEVRPRMNTSSDTQPTDITSPNTMGHFAEESSGPATTFIRETSNRMSLVPTNTRKRPSSSGGRRRCSRVRNMSSCPSIHACGP